MKKALIVATVGGFICSFEKNNIRLLKNLGYEVFIACNIKGREEELAQLGCHIFHLPIERSPFKKKNVISYQQLKALIEREKFDLVHCHTPVGGVLARMASRKYRKTGTKVIYTAHGFHFFKGAPLVNWIIYYPIERWLSRYTDVLVTINNEDNERAKTFHAKKVEYIPGVGVDLEKFKPINSCRNELRKEFGILEDDIVLLSVGELIKRKNHKIIIEALGEIENKKVKYLICGQGTLKTKLQQLAEYCGISDRVYFGGFRKDIVNMCLMSDIFVFPSLQEGLPVALMEAMACGLPVICSDIRGNNELVIQGKGGKRVNANDSYAFAHEIQTLVSSLERREQYGNFNQKHIKSFGKDKVNKIMERIYDNTGKKESIN